MPIRKDTPYFPKPEKIPGSPATATAAVLIPSTIPGLTLWLDANQSLYQDSGLTIPATADNEPIAAWRDQAGTYHMTQATAANRPVVVTGQANGRRIVHFDGTNDWMSAVGSIALPFTWISCFSIYGTTGTLQGVFSSNNFPTGGNSSSFAADLSTFGAFGSVQTVTVPSGFEVWAATVTSTTATLYQDLNTIGAVTSTNSAINKPLLASATTTSPTFFAKMNLAEMLVYSGVLSSGDLVTLINYLKNKYGA